MNAPAITVRDARPNDLALIVAFNDCLARETESKILDHDALSRGVAAALADPERLRYWIAEDPASGAVVGQAAVTREWSDWRNGWLWWLQSVYVRADARQRGAFRSLHHAIRSAALESSDVVGLRLYVEHDNADARRTYDALGFVPGGYEVYEEIFL